MFTGIIEKLGCVVSADPRANGRRLRLDIGDWRGAVQPGQSLAVNGVCLTVVHTAAAGCELDVVPETLRRTALEDLQAGDAVNLERSMQAGGRFDGHFVQGHVDAVARVLSVPAASSEQMAWFEHDEACAPLIIPKGSIAIDGVSLTIAQTSPGAFSVALIPVTLERTTLSRLRPRQRVNIETDLIARAVAHQLAAFRPPEHADLLQLLVKEGFA